MASDVMRVRLHLPQVRVLGVVEDTAARLARAEVADAKVMTLRAAARRRGVAGRDPR